MTEEQIIAALVKPLVWDEKDRAIGFGCLYFLAHDFDGWRWFQCSRGGVLEGVSTRPFREKADAQAAAEADYRARIAAALNLGPVVALVGAGKAYKDARIKVDDTPEFCDFVTALAAFGGSHD